MKTINIEDSHDSVYVDYYVDELVDILLTRSLKELNSNTDAVDTYAVRMAIGALQTAVDDVVIKAKRDYEEEQAEAEAYQRDPYRYNGVRRSDFM